MRIALLLHQPLDSGGDMARAVALARELGRRGHRVSLVCEAPGSQAAGESPDFEIIPAPRFAPALLRERGLHPRSLVWRWRRLRRRSFDIVHTFGVRPSVILPALWLQRRGTIWVADWSDLWGTDGIASQRGSLGRWTIGALDDRLEKASRRRADGLTVVSTFLAALSRSQGIPGENTLLIGGGADCEVIEPMDREQARRSLALRSEGPIVVFSGHSKFDLGLLRQTYHKLKEARPELRLLLLGGASAADLEASDDRRVLDMGFLPVAAMATALAAGDVMLLPLPRATFNRARFPNRLGDYMAAARPVVTNQTGDAGRLVADEGIGLAVNDDPSSVSRAVLKLLERPELAAEMGARARRLAEERMDWTHLSERLEAFYRRF